MYFRKKYIEKKDLQESYNNFKIKCRPIVSFCESGPRGPEEILDDFKIINIRHRPIYEAKKIIQSYTNIILLY